MLEALLMLLGIGAAALLLIAFWALHRNCVSGLHTLICRPFGQYRRGRRSSGRPDLITLLVEGFRIEAD